MVCCGDKRAQLNQTRQRLDPGEQADPVYFQYTGRTGLTVIGRETRSHYRFDSPGAVVAVDIRDKPALAHVPNLRPVKGLSEPYDTQISEPHDAQITIGSVQLTPIEPSPEAPEKRLRAEIRFQLSGEDAGALASNALPYQISIYTIEFGRGTPVLVLSKDSQLEPNKFEYSDRLEFAEPAAGRYEFHNVVRLPPSGKLMGYHRGPTLTIRSSPNQ